MEAVLALCLHAAAHYNDIAAAWRFTVNLPPEEARDLRRCLMSGGVSLPFAAADLEARQVRLFLLVATVLMR
jgi:hypothetical protein